MLCFTSLRSRDAIMTSPSRVYILTECNDALGEIPSFKIAGVYLFEAQARYQASLGGYELQVFEMDDNEPGGRRIE
jgi:hypothetical protein